MKKYALIIAGAIITGNTVDKLRNGGMMRQSLYEFISLTSEARLKIMTCKVLDETRKKCVFSRKSFCIFHSGYIIEKTQIIFDRTTKSLFTNFASH